MKIPSLDDWEKIAADARRRAQRATANRHRVTPEVAGEFLPRETKSFTRPAPCNSVIYGVVGMEFFQLAGEGVNAPSPKW
jgi:hypothetical protein